MRAPESAMANPSSSSTPQPRGRCHERRGFAVFLAALASQPTAGSRPALSHDHLDSALRALVPIRSARLTTASVGGLSGPHGGAPGVLRFPVSTPERPGLHLEVTLDPARGLDSWDRQALGNAARVLGLMLGPRREAASGRSGSVADGAAPLIGSSACMQHLRRQIERVAATDFTVLIQGETGSGKELVARQVLVGSGPVV